MKYRVLVLRRAASDAQVIYDWLAERSPAGAYAWYRALNDVLDRLEERPESWGIAVESPRRNITIREAFFRTAHGRTYRILFAIVDDSVRVIHVLGPGQAYPDDLI